MLSQGERDLRQRNIIVDVSERGLMLRIDGRPKAAPWMAVVEVSAGKALLDRSSGLWILVLAIEIDLGGEIRVFLLAEVEPAWLALAAILPTTLPEIAPFEQWGATLVAARCAPAALSPCGGFDVIARVARRMLGLIGERRQALAQRVEPGDLGRVGAAHGACEALLRLEAQANNIHGGFPPRSSLRSRGKQRVRGHG